MRQVPSDLTTISPQAHSCFHFVCFTLYTSPHFITFLHFSITKPSQKCVTSHIVLAWHNKTMMTLQNVVLTFQSSGDLSPAPLYLHLSLPFLRSCPPVSPHSCPDPFFSPFLLPRCNRVTCCQSGPFKERRELRWAAPLGSDLSCQWGGAYCGIFLNGKVRDTIHRDTKECHLL